MEYNKDEAALAVDIAVKKLQEKDFATAKKFVIKAQNLLPDMEGIQNLLEVINVNSYGTMDIHGERNWYAILRVNPLDSVEIIKKAYRRLLLLVHPDKNKWPGANHAVHLVHEAWKSLSDKERRASYDQTRKGKQVSNDIPTDGASTSKSVPFSGGHFDNMFNDNGTNPTRPPTTPRPASKPQPQKGARSSSKPRARKGSSKSSSKKARTSQPYTFWTVCSHCKMRYEFERMYLNAKLMCPASECNRLFSATMISPPRKKYERNQNAGRRMPKADKCSASQDMPGSSSSFQVRQEPSLATTITRVPSCSTAHGPPGKWTAEGSKRTYEEAQDVILEPNAGTDDSGSVGKPTKKARGDRE